MSTVKSYFSKNDTLIYNSFTNTGRNPVIELFYGRVDNIIPPPGFSRLIFDINLDLLQEQVADGTISTGCSRSMTHVLKMTNTSQFDEALLNGYWSDGRRRATSFDLILFRIPKVSVSTGNLQTWDEGVGYDYYNSAVPLNSSNAQSVTEQLLTDKTFSTRPVNWYQRTTIDNWSTPGLYNNTNSLTSLTGLNYSALTIVDVQHFEFGNEDIEFDMTNEINNILTGATTGHTGWGVAFVPQVENLTGLTENYAVGFFSRHTQTFYEPYLETTYDDLITDDRNNFIEGQTNKLYLYTYVNGNPIKLDTPPVVTIYDQNDDIIQSGITSCMITRGVYEISVSGITATTIPCMFYDVWSGLSYNGISIANVENEFVLKSNSNYFQIGTSTQTPKIYAFNFFGIRQNEKIINTDIRKVTCIIRQAYSSNVVLNTVDAYYRVYVREGQTEVEVQGWTPINRTPDSFYFVFDTRDKIPNEYFIDMKVVTDLNVDIYKQTLQFQIVNRK